MEHKSTTARDVQRMLAERVRSDWNFERDTRSNLASPILLAPEDRAERIVQADSETSQLADTLLDDVCEWRERTYSTTSPSASEDEEEQAGDNNKTEPNAFYKFHGPDSVGSAISQRRLLGKRKRRQALEEEMQWNDGLAFFVARRDAWSGARTSSETRSEITDALVLDNPNISIDASQEDVPTRWREHMIPLVPPLISPMNPIRAAINVNSYTSIYNKVICAGQTPNIPINLSDVTRALVHGWKEAGEWPPKSSVLEPAIAKRRVKAVETRKGRADEAVPDTSGGDIRSGDFKTEVKHPHIKRGVEGVKRVLRLSTGSGSGYSASNG